MELGDDLGDDVVILRAWLVDDAGWYADSVRDAEVQRCTTDPPTLTAADVAAAITALPDQPEQVARLITDAATGERLGNIALTCHDGVGDVSYWVAAGARGRSVGSHALTLISDAALTQLGLHELRLWTHAANIASQCVAERAGFNRDPEQERSREIKGETWPTVPYHRWPPGVQLVELVSDPASSATTGCPPPQGRTARRRRPSAVHRAPRDNGSQAGPPRRTHARFSAADPAEQSAGCPPRPLLRRSPSAVRGGVRRVLSRRPRRARPVAPHVGVPPPAHRPSVRQQWEELAARRLPELDATIAPLTNCGPQSPNASLEGA